MKHRVPDQPCPRCAGSLSGATNANESHAAPAQGDATFCAYCGLILVFGAGLRVREPTEAEWLSFTSDQRRFLVRMSEAVHAAWLMSRR